MSELDVSSSFVITCAFTDSVLCLCMHLRGLLCLDYTQGFDGPGRPNIEDDANNIQTLQYGARNDAWSSIEDLFVELEYGQKSSDSELVVGELISLVQKVTQALDAYLSLAPAADVEQASVIKSRR